MLFAPPMWLALAVAQPAPAVMLPSGQWSLDRGTGDCLIGRQFGTGDDGVLIGWRVAPLATDQMIVLNEPDHFEPTQGVAVTVTLANGRQDHGNDVVAGVVDEHRITRFSLAASFFDGASDGELMTISRPGVRDVSVRLDGMPRATAALTTCNGALAKGWGVDPNERERIGTPAVGGAGAWITDKDYPSDAVRLHQQGTVGMFWTIGLDGRVHDCRITQSSGFKSLDTASCSALTKRGHYVPAKDKEGKPMVTHATRSVNWILPSS